MGEGWNVAKILHRGVVGFVAMKWGPLEVASFIILVSQCSIAWYSSFPCVVFGCGRYAAIAISLFPTPGWSRAIAM